MKIKNQIQTVSVSIVNTLIFFALFSFQSAVATGKDFADTAKADAGVFRPPVTIPETLNWIPYYPESALENGQTGYVEVGFMVDEEGKAYEPLILVSTNALFNQAAIEGVIAARFDPATLDGQPVDSFANLKVFFEDPNRKHKIRRSASMLLRAFKKEIERDDADQTRAADLLDEMAMAEKVNYAFSLSLTMSRLQYALRFGKRVDQIAAYKEAMLFGSSTTAFAAELVGLLIEEGNYGEAYQVYETYLSEVDPDSLGKTLKAIQQPMAQIKDIKNSDQAVAREVILNGNGSKHLPLFKNLFALDSVTGEISTLKLRCKRRFVELSFNLESDYQIPNSWGECNLEILGSPGSSARLIQQ